MLRCLRIVPEGEWTGTGAVDEVSLDLEGRRRRRQMLTGSGGTRFLLDLAAVPDLGDGDGLLLDDGRIVRVRAAAEPLVEVHAGVDADLPRLAWHLGNRHVPVEFANGGLRVRRDHVIEAMLVALGAELRPLDIAFRPEGGAYGPADHHG